MNRQMHLDYQADRIEVTVWREGREDAATDVTLRRCQNFKIEPGKTYAWVNKTPAGAEVEKGEVTVEKDGLLTLGAAFRSIF